MAVEQGFTKAQTDNLPCVSEGMIIDFFKQNLDFLSAEIRGIKAEKSTRESYADNAVAYVQLRRVGNICEVKARMTPEHNTRKKAYSVALQCDESTKTLLSVTCDGCAAQKGGCKHAIAYMFWVHRKSSLPSTTEKLCYWKKSSLSCVGTSTKIVYANQMGKKPIKSLPPKDPHILNEFVSLLNQKNIYDLQISGLFHKNAIKENVSLHFLKMKFELEYSMHTPENFLSYLQLKMTDDFCREAEAASVSQGNSSNWHELRYGRVTASKIYEASRCKTMSGSLVESVLGAKFRLNNAIKRGRLLEAEVLEKLKEKHNSQILPSGFITNNTYPFAGASPDGINEEFVVEVKCPSSITTMGKYFKNGMPSEKHYAQIQMQMLFANKLKGLFCVAHPDFESTRLTTEVWVDFNQQFCDDLLSKARIFLG